MELLKYLYGIPLFFFSLTVVHSLTPPINYTINVPNVSESSMNGFQNGMKIAEQAQKNKRAKELREREEMYRKDLKYFYDNPAEVKRSNLGKLLLIYPEFSSQTQQIIDSLEKNGLLKD